MVAIRRVKRLIQFSVLAVSLATLLLFLKWSDVSDLENSILNKKGVESLDWDDNEYDQNLIHDREREFDVNEILKEVNKDGAVGKEDWETAFNNKAKRQVEKKNSNLHSNNLDKWKKEQESKNHEYDKRRLKGVSHENQTRNNTTTQTSAEGLNSLHTGSPVNNSARKGPVKDGAGVDQAASHGHPIKQNPPSWKKSVWTSDMLGALNVHVWQAWCGSTIHDLRRNKFFPLYPDVRLTITKFVIRHWEADYGQRVFGYIHPPVSGKYTFAISSDDTSELWLSTNDNPSNVRLIAWVGNRTLLSGTFKTKLAQFTKYRTQLSKPVFLRQGQKYFIEALHKQASLAEHLLVGWKIPGLNNIRHISGSSISLFINEKKSTRDVSVYAEYIPQDLPSHSHGQYSMALDPSVFKFGSDDSRDKAHKAKFVDERHLKNLFPSCPYKPSYLVDFELRRYDGVKLIHDTAVYPDDFSDLSHMRQYDKCVQHRLKDSYGNKLGSLAPDLVSNHSLYENGSIIIFRGGKGFLPLSLAKSALERQQAEEQLLETQMDLVDIKRLSKDPEGPTELSRRTSPSEKSYSTLKQDKEKAFEVKKKAKRKPRGSVKKGVQRKKRSNVSKMKSRDNKGNLEDDKKSEHGASKRRKTRGHESHDQSRVQKARDQSPNQKSSDQSHNQKSRDQKSLDQKSRDQTSRDQTSRDQKTRDSQLHQSSKGVAPKGPQRKLLSHDVSDNESFDRSANRAEQRSPTSSSHSQTREANTPGREVRKSQQRRIKTQFAPVDYQDDLMTRMNAAREYVRRMAGIVQKYNHKLNPRVLSDAVYKRFGVKMKIPNIVRVPEYNDWLFHQNSSKCASDGNLLLNAEVATSVANGYMRALRRLNESQYSLKEIANVEENHDIMNGDRYLVELDLNVKGKNSSVRLSQFVYQKIGSAEFCLPEGFVLDQHATVHIIIPVKNQGKWVQHFIDNMVELYQETADPHVNVILVDFSSTDIDVMAAFKRSPLKRYQVKKLKGAFQRAYGIHAGATLVTNPHDIIFMCDLHLQIPAKLIDSIRKHCVEGKMAFAPIVARLHCGFSPLLPFGFWELQGYGLFAMYKSDYTRVGGMNYKEFRTTWGGEDWDLLDRVLLYKMEVERLRIPKFYHFYHSKKGMWGSRNTIFTSKSDHVFGRYDDEGDVITLYDESKGGEDEDVYMRRLQFGDEDNNY